MLQQVFSYVLSLLDKTIKPKDTSFKYVLSYSYACLLCIFLDEGRRRKKWKVEYLDVLLNFIEIREKVTLSIFKLSVNRTHLAHLYQGGKNRKWKTQTILSVRLHFCITD